MMDGNLPAKSEKMLLREEIAKLREELAVVYEANAAWKRRAEAAEARIKEAEGQKPYAYEVARAMCEPELAYKKDKSAIHNKKLYTRPIPPADVAELQKRIAELERKLAEQQATVVKLYEMFGKELPNSAEELNALIAKARAEAVPEGWKEQYDIFLKDYARYVEGDTSMPFSMIRLSLAAFIEVCSMLAATSKPGSINENE